MWYSSQLCERKNENNLISFSWWSYCFCLVDTQADKQDMRILKQGQASLVIFVSTRFYLFFKLISFGVILLWTFVSLILGSCRIVSLILLLGLTGAAGKFGNQCSWGSWKMPRKYQFIPEEKKNWQSFQENSFVSEVKHYLSLVALISLSLLFHQSVCSKFEVNLAITTTRFWMHHMVK